MPELHYLTFTDPYELARPRHVAYYEWGDPKNSNVAVCVHGLSRNAGDFDLLAAELSKTHRVICIDMAGRGKSDWLVNKSGYTYSLYIGDCMAVLDHLQLKQVAWIGTSMGGIIGMMIAAGHKGRISNLVLNDVGAVVSAAGLKRILGYVGVGSAFNNAEEAMAYLKSVMAPFHISSEEHWRHMFAISLIPLADGRYAPAYDPGINQPFRDAVSQKEGISDVNLVPVWNEVSCKALILRGELSDILTKQAAEAMLPRTAPTKLVEIKDTGHAPALLEESQIRIIVDWLAAGA